MIFQVVHHHFDDARCSFTQIEIFSGREPAPYQPVQHRLDEDNRHFLVQITRQILIFHRFGQKSGDFLAPDCLMLACNGDNGGILLRVFAF